MRSASKASPAVEKCSCWRPLTSRRDIAKLVRLKNSFSWLPSAGRNAGRRPACTRAGRALSQGTEASSTFKLVKQDALSVFDHQEQTATASVHTSAPAWLLRKHRRRQI